MGLPHKRHTQKASKDIKTRYHLPWPARFIAFSRAEEGKKSRLTLQRSLPVPRLRAAPGVHAPHLPQRSAHSEPRDAGRRWWTPKKWGNYPSSHKHGTCGRVPGRSFPLEGNPLSAATATWEAGYTESEMVRFCFICRLLFWGSVRQASGWYARL